MFSANYEEPANYQTLNMNHPENKNDQSDYQSLTTVKKENDLQVWFCLDIKVTSFFICLF